MSVLPLLLWPGLWCPFTNIAKVLGDGGVVLDEDQADTEVCVQVPGKPTPGKPGLPATGADPLPLGMGALALALLGSGLLVARKRHSA